MIRFSTNIIDMVVLLVQCALWNKKLDESSRIRIEKLSTDEWNSLYELASQQSVLAIVFDALLQSGVAMPRPLKMRFIYATARIQSDYNKKMKAVYQMIDMFSKERVDMMILKGIGLSLMYPIPEHRQCGDVDIYLFGEQQRIDNVLRDKYNIDINVKKHHHTVFFVGDVMVENHFDFIEQHSRIVQHHIESELKRIAQEGQHIEQMLDGGKRRAFIPSPNLNALFLLYHSGLHFAAGGISIRHLIDWSLFVKNYGSKVDWTRIYALGDRYGFTPYLNVLNALCIEKIGIDASLCPAYSTEQSLIERAWSDVIDYAEQMNIPHSFIKGWMFRIRRRFANSWKQKLMCRDNAFVSFFMSIAIHILPPNFFRRFDRY